MYIYIYLSISIAQRLGKATKVLGNIKLPPPLNLEFFWEKQRY